jgi:hypothetical protein
MRLQREQASIDRGRMNARHASISSHHIMPIRQAEWAQPPTIPSALRAVAPGTGQAHRTGCAADHGRPKPFCSLIIGVIILTTQRRANTCGDTDTASLHAFLSGSSFGPIVLHALPPDLRGCDGRSCLPTGVCPEVKSLIEFLFMLAAADSLSARAIMDPLSSRIDLRAVGGDGNGG